MYKLEKLKQQIQSEKDKPNIIAMLKTLIGISPEGEEQAKQTEILVWQAYELGKKYAKKEIDPLECNEKITDTVGDILFIFAEKL